MNAVFPSNMVSPVMTKTAFIAACATTVENCEDTSRTGITIDPFALVLITVAVAVAALVALLWRRGGWR
jgi:preprotein translocase subunit Sec61beta